ncbi:MAG: hypothetical protein QOJ09_3077 [Actinomycetota bacterium]|jgi:hypothetical protein|nr:hypothetical protein [Actinomycetota bacterium]
MHTHDHDHLTEHEEAAPSRQREGTGPAEHLLRLQQQAGNRGVTQLLAAQRAAASAGEGELDPSAIHDVVGRGGGQPLDRGTRAEMETALGHDFSDVRVHTGPAADASAKSVQAQAFTAGNEVVFGAGQFDPGSTAGKRTLAHELTHVVQQRSGPVDGTDVGDGVSLSHPSDQFERAASAAGEAAAAGGQGVLGDAAAGPATAAVQRQTGEEEKKEEESPAP